MTGGIVLSVVAPHSPRMGHEATAPDFIRGLIDGLRDLGDEIRAARPDAIVLCSTHWVTTFNWYLAGAARHQGRCLPDEAPDMFPPIAYDRPGDPELAEAIRAIAADDGIPAFSHDVAEYSWDYGSCVPLAYIDPDQRIPVVLLGTCIMADIAESMRIGHAIRQAAEQTGKRVVFIASSALTHALVRGPDRWPTEARQALDRRFIDLAGQGDIGVLKQWFPTFAKEGEGEMGGRVIAVMLGTLDETADRYRGHQVGPYAQSSGSGNAAVVVEPVG